MLRQSYQGLGQYVGEHHVCNSLGFVLGKVEFQTVFLHIITSGVFPAGLQSLRVGVHANNMLCAQQQGGKAQNARATAVINYLFAGYRVTVKPFEAKRGGLVGSGTKGKAGVQQKIGGVGIRRLVPAGDNP